MADLASRESQARRRLRARAAVPSEIEDSMYDMLSDLPTSDEDANTDSLRSESEAGDDDANGRGESDSEAFGLGEEDKDGFTPFEMPRSSQQATRAYEVSARLDSEAETERLLMDDLSKITEKSSMTDSSQTARPYDSSAILQNEADIARRFTDDIVKSSVIPGRRDDSADRQMLGAISDNITWFCSEYFNLSFDPSQAQIRRRVGVAFCFIGFILAAVSTINAPALWKYPQASVHDITGAMSQDISSTATLPAPIVPSSLKTSLKGLTTSSSIVLAKTEKTSSSKKMAINAQPSIIGTAQQVLNQPSFAPVQSSKAMPPPEPQPKNKFIVCLDSGQVLPYTKDNTRKHSNHRGPYTRLAPKEEKFGVRFTDSPNYGFNIVALSPVPYGNIVVIVSKVDRIIQRGQQSRKDADMTWTPAFLPEDEIHGYINVTVIMPSAQQFQSSEIDLGSAWLHLWRWTKALSPYADPLKEHVKEGIKFRMSQAQQSANAVTRRSELSKVMTEIERTGREIWGTAIMSVSDKAAKAVSKYRLGVGHCAGQTYRSATQPIMQTLAKAQARTKILQKRVLNKRLLKRTAAGNTKTTKEGRGKKGLFM